MYHMCWNRVTKVFAYCIFLICKWLRIQKITLEQQSLCINKRSHCNMNCWSVSGVLWSVCHSVKFLAVGRVSSNFTQITTVHNSITQVKVKTSKILLKNVLFVDVRSYYSSPAHYCCNSAVHNISTATDHFNNCKNEPTR